MGVNERREREKRFRRESILDAAEKLIFSKGLEQTTMDEVAEAVELSKGTLYLYFKNKEDLFHGIVHRAIVLLNGCFERALAVPLKSGIDKLQAIADSYLEFYQKYPDYITVMMHREAGAVAPGADAQDVNPFQLACADAGNRILGLLGQVVEEGMADGTIRNDLDPIPLALIMWGNMTGALLVVASKRCVLEQFGITDPDHLLDEAVARIRDYLNPALGRKDEGS